MLILSRHVGKKVVFDFSKVIDRIDSNPAEAKAALERVVVMPVRIKGHAVRIGVDAHELVSVHREEVQERIDAEPAA